MRFFDPAKLILLVFMHAPCSPTGIPKSCGQDENRAQKCKKTAAEAEQEKIEVS